MDKAQLYISICKATDDGLFERFKKSPLPTAASLSM